MDLSEVSMCGDVRSVDDHEVDIDSFDLDIPSIKEKGTSLDEIKRHVLKERFNVYPHQDIRTGDETKTILCHRLQSLSRKGLAYIADNLSVSASISRPKLERQPEDGILDVCLLVQGLPPTVFTLVKDNSVSLNKVKSYNLTLVQGVIKAVRRLTTEQFSVVYGIIQKSELNTQEDFQRRLETLKDTTSRMCVPDSLKMHGDKCMNIIKAFLSSVALTCSVVNDNNSDTLWFLTLEQFRILTENIDQRQVTVRTAPSCGGKVLMREIAQRLEKSGPTLLVMKTDEEIQVARNQKICFLMFTLGEWKDRLVKGVAMDGIINLVTNCQDCPAVPELKGRCWSFIPEIEEQNAIITEIMDENATLGLEEPTSETKKQKAELMELMEDNTTIRLTQEEPTLENEKQKSKLKETMEENATLRLTKEELTSENEKQKAKITELMEENETLRLRELQVSRMLDSVALSSGQGSDSSRLASWMSTLSVDRQGATGGQKETKGILKSIKKMLGGSKSKALKDVPVKEVPVYLYVLHNEDRTHTITVACRTHGMDRQRVYTKSCHLTEDGQLVNSQITDRVQQGSLRFTTFCGTCSTFSIPLSTPTSSMTPVPPAPQYWDTETAVKVMERLEWGWPTILEVSVVEEDQLDRDGWVHDRPRSWCVKVGWCDIHKGYCTQVWNEKKHVKCVRDALSDTPGTSQTLRYGMGFVDVERGIVLEKMDVQFRQTVYPVFSVVPDVCYYTVQVKLVSGSNIQMSEDKQKLIYNCLI